MTPEEKAIELVQKFMDIKHKKLSDYSVIYHPTAKECALILVNEIIDWHLEFLFISKESVGHEYWEEVKKQINNL